MRDAAAVVLLVGLSLAARAQDAAPAPPDGFLFRPTIHAAGEARRAGHAFAVTWQASGDAAPRPLVLTCLHLFGPAGGLPEQLDGQRLEDVVDRVELADPRRRGGAPRVVRRALPLPGSFAADDDRGPGGDVVAFEVDDPVRFAPRPLAAATPRVGARVWLWAQLVGEREPRAVPARVSEVTDGEWSALFDGPGQVELRATSGAPWLDAEGRIVGVNVGGWDDGGRTYGWVCPVERVRALLEGARTTHGAPSSPEATGGRPWLPTLVEGAQWQYSEVLLRGGERRRLLFRGVAPEELDDGTTVHVLRAFVGPEDGSGLAGSGAERWVERGGVPCLRSRSAGPGTSTRYEPALPAFPDDPRPGASTVWRGQAVERTRAGDGPASDLEVRLIVEAEEELETRAGRFTCLRVVQEWPGGARVTRWWAAAVGVVKEEAPAYRRELVRFRPAE